MIRRTAVAIALVVWLAAPALAREPWDQAALISLSAEFAGATRTLRDELAAEPGILDGTQRDDPTAGGLLASSAALGKASRRLSRALADGGDYDKTLPIATQIRALLGEIQQQGTDALGAARTEALLAPLQGMMGSIGPYYFD